MKELFDKLNVVINGLNARERVLFMLGILVLIYVLWQTFFFEGMSVQKVDLTSKITNKELQVKELQKQYEDLIKQLEGDQKYGVLNDKIDKLRQLNRSLETEIVKFTKKLIPPNEMVAVLERILKNSSNIKLISLTNLEEASLFETLTSKSKEEGDDQPVSDKLDIFKHGISIEIEGTYFDIMAFLYKLEQVKWNIVWDQLDYEVTEYPMAKTKIVLYTLSLSSNWLNFGQ